MLGVEELKVHGGMLVFAMSHICGENGKGILSGLSPRFYSDQGIHSEAVTQAMWGGPIEVHIPDDLSRMIKTDIFADITE